jgi:enamine deaminase RidA (YjgF/YER057c/UK114 family)
MTKTVITSDKAPAAIGTYSQAIKAGNTVYMSGQIPLDPKTMELVEGFEAQTVQVFENLKPWLKPLAVRSRTSSS